MGFVNGWSRAGRGLICAAALVGVSGSVASAQTTGFAGSSQAFDNRQESIALSFVTRGFGIFGLGGPVRIFAYPRSVVTGFLGGGDWLPLEGQALPISNYDVLFAELGTTYGGDGQTNFALPDLRERVVVGSGSLPGGSAYTFGQTAGSSSRTLLISNIPAHSHALSPTRSTLNAGGNQAFDNRQATLAMAFSTRLSGIFPSFDGGGSVLGPGNPMLGQVYLSCRPPLNNGWLQANGTLLPISQNQAVFVLMGTQYGGNGQTTFAVPNLNGRMPMALSGTSGPSVVGQPIGAEQVSILISNLPPHSHTIPGGTTSTVGGGQAVENRQPGLGLQFAIATSGVYPSFRGIDDQQGYIGEIIMFAGNFPPNGTLRCEGQLLPISQNTALFSLIGTTFGGNGVTTFALPDLRGRAIVGASTNWAVGEVRGSNTVTLTAAQMPSHNHSFVPCGLSDVAGANQAVGANGTLTADDIIVFLGWFFGNDPRANVAGANQSTTPDAVLTADDIIVFLSRFFAGC